MVEIIQVPVNTNLIIKSKDLTKSFYNIFKKMIEKDEDISDIISTDGKSVREEQKITSNRVRDCIKNSRLFQPILELCATKNKIDISDCINNLSKESLLLLEHPSSILDLHKASKQANPNATLDKTHFTKLFKQLIDEKHDYSENLIKLAHGDLINIEELDINDTYKNNTNILMLLVENNDTESVQKIIEMYTNNPSKTQIDLNILYNKEISVLDYALAASDSTILTQLIALNKLFSKDKQIDINNRCYLSIALVYNNFENLKILLNEFPDIDVNNANDFYKHAALMRAAHSECIEAVPLLINSGANINFNNNSEETALFFAVRNRNTDVLAYFKDADMSFIDCHGDTILFRALYSQNITFVKKYLIDQAVFNVNYQNNYGETALMISIHGTKNNPQLKEFAKINQKIDFTLTDNHGRTAMQIAKESDKNYGTKNQEAIQFLMDNQKKKKLSSNSSINKAVLN